jgi:hypothetical protein
MLSSFLAQQKEQAPLSPRIGGLIDQAGRNFGAAGGYYQQPDLSTAQGATQAALQAQKYGHTADYAEYMKQAAQLRQQEAAETMQSRKMAADRGLQQLGQQHQTAENRLQREHQSQLQDDKLAMERYGIDATTASAKERELLKSSAAMERLSTQIKSEEGVVKQKLEHELKMQTNKLEKMWEIADMEEKGRMARALITANAAASKDSMPSKHDLEALAIMAKSLPEKLQKKLGTDKWIGGDKAALETAGKIWRAVQDGVDPNDAMQLVADGQTYANGKWSK